LAAYGFSDDGYSFVAVNQADPGEPMPGLDPAGDPIAQPPHPILGDRAVRQALAHGVDYERLIAQVYAGYGQRLTSAVLPTVGWAYAADLPAIAYDPGRAATLLDEAGWTLNGAAIRQRAGQLLTLRLLVNDDDGVRLALAAALAEMWRALGVDVVVDAVSFEEMTTALLDQTYDLAVAGWSDLGADPLHEAFWRRAGDRPGFGFNFTSYANPQVEGLMDAALGLPGCDPAQRGEIYGRIQAQLQADVPYIFLSTQRSALVYNSGWQGIDPGPWGYSSELAGWFWTEK
jgi:peptide/nickel transport system substrate-binding protein